MGIKFKSILLVCTGLLSLAVVTGCGGSGEPARQDVLEIPPEEAFGGGVKQTIYDFRATFRASGVNGAKQAIEGVIESLGDYEGAAVGDHADTYKQITDGAGELQTMLNGSPSSAEVGTKVDELVALAEKLPGKADEKGVASN